MSITEVAKKAGVSHATVSRVINRREGVSQETVKRVEDIMVKMGFVPRPVHERPGPRPKMNNRIKTGQVMLLHSYITESTATRAPASIMLSNGIQAELARRELNMLVSIFDHSDQKVPHALLNRAVDGVIIVGHDPSLSVENILKGYPVVGAFSNLERFWGDCVHIDNEAVSKMAVKYLVERGHEQIALIDPYPRLHVNLLRAEYFCKAAKEASAKAVTILSSEGAINGTGKAVEFSFNAQSLIDRVLDVLPNVSGFFVPGDMFVSMVYQELVNRKGQFTKNFDVISVNQHPMLSMKSLEHRPVIIDCKPGFVGRRAVEQLFWRLENPDEPQQTILIKPSLFEP